MFLLFALLSFNDFQMPQVGGELPASVWQVREDPERGIYDAVILEDVFQFNWMGIDRYRSIRILSENGKEAAGFFDETGTAGGLKGRVIDVSGKITHFDTKKDLVEVLGLKTREGATRTRILLPPGLTDNCVVEYSWGIGATDGLPWNTYRKDYLVREDYFCKRKVFRIERKVLSTRAGFYSTRVGWTKPQPPATFDQQEKRGSYTIIYGNLPARENHPYGNELLDPGSGLFTVYKTIPDFGRNPDQFWNRLGRDYFRESYNGKINSREYRAWLKDLKSRLPEDHVQAAVMAYNALRERVSATDLLPPRLKAVYAKHGRITKDQPDWRARCFELGYAEPEQLSDLFFSLGRDLDLPLQFLFTTPSFSVPFSAEALDPFRLNILYPFFGIKVDNSWVTFAPAYQNYPAGMLPPFWQGGQAITFDPGNRWKYGLTRLARFGPGVHQKIRRYQMDIGADGRGEVSIQEEGSGVFNADHVATYLPLPPDEAAEHLKHQWQTKIGEWQITEAVVAGAESPNNQVKVRVAAEAHFDLGDDWFALNPFPADSLPIGLPDIWPKNRKQPIILPHTFTAIDLAKINLPQGWTLRGNANWSKENEIGKVSFTVVKKDRVLTVRRDLILARDMLPPDKEKQLKYLLAWMEEAYYQTLGLERERVN